MKKLYIDFETRAIVDIKKVGAWGYAAHPLTEIMCLAYSWDGAPVVVLTLADLNAGRRPWVEGGRIDDFILVAHNAHFEYAVYHSILVARAGWPAIEDPNRWECTLARAAMSNLPISLGHCAAALNVPQQKDFTGRAAMLKLCKPVDTDPVSLDPIYNEDLELYAILYQYCAKDVEVEIALDRILPALPASEKAIWNLDLIINKRGVQIDVALARSAAELARELTTELNFRLNSLTGGAVSKASRIAEIKKWCAVQGVTEITSLDKPAVVALMARADVPAMVKEVLAVRQQVGKSSTAKYEAAVNAAMADGRARGLLQYHAAGTGRWGGRLLQPQNFPKGLDARAQAAAIEAINGGGAQVFSLMYGDQAMETLSGALRGVITAARGKQLVVADFNAIEPRVLFWGAGDAEALKTYRSGGSPYLDMGSFIYKRPITRKDAAEYAVAKMTILGCGYGMGALRFQAQCADYGIVVDARRARPRARPGAT